MNPADHSSRDRSGDRGPSAGASAAGGASAERATPWARLVAAARRARAGSSAASPAAGVTHVADVAHADLVAGDCAAPAGFATRVVARAGLRPASAGLFGGASFERLAARALALSGVCALGVSVWFGLPATAAARSAASVEAAVAAGAAATDAYLDPVGALLEVVDS